MGRNKYGATKVNRNGRWFDSKAEASLYDILKARQDAGVITELQCQAQVLLTDAKILYKPDFKFIDHDGKERYAEFKGVRTASWNIKKRLWKVCGPGPLEIWTGPYTNVKLSEVLEPSPVVSICPGCGLKYHST